MIETRGLRKVWATSAMRALFASHLSGNVVWEGAIVVAALTALVSPGRRACSRAA